VCGLPASIACTGDQADFLDADPACAPVGRACADPWPALPEGTIYVDPATTTLEQALGQLEPNGPRTLALEPGAHAAASAVSDVRIVGRCTETMVAVSGPLARVRFENVTLDAALPPDASFSLASGVLRSFTADTASVSISRSLSRSTIALAGSLTVRESVLQPSSGWAVELRGGSITMEDVRVESDLAVTMDRAVAVVRRVASRGTIAAATSTLTLDRIASGPIAAGAAIHVESCTLTARDVVIAGAMFGVVIANSAAAIERLVVRGSIPASVAGVVVGSKLALAGLLLDGTFDGGFSLASSTATITDAYVALGEPPPMNQSIAFLTGAGSELTLRRAQVTASKPNGICANGAGSSRMRLFDLDCRTAAATGFGIGLFEAGLYVERGRIEGFRNSIYQVRSNIEAEDLTTICGPGPNDEQGGGLYLEGGRFRARRLHLLDCPENGILARGYTNESFEIEDVTFTDCYIGLALRNGGGTAKRIEVVRARRRGISLNGNEELGLASGALSDVRVLESDPGAVAAIEGTQIESMVIERYLLEGGAAGVSVGNKSPTASDGIIRGTTVGFIYLSPLDVGLLELVEDVQLVGVTVPIDRHLDR
jgi:hypothetical protein